MTIVTETEIEAYAFCPNSRCDGNTQKKVKALKTLVEFTYMDLGGNLPGVERSTAHLKFKTTKQSPCTVCGVPRELSETRRRKYAPTVINDKVMDPKALLDYMPDRFAEDYEPEYEVVE